jgi:hypothetical protein
MTTTTPTTIWQALDQTLAEANAYVETLAAERNAALDARERELAKAAEEVCPPVLEIGIGIGMEQERERVLLLIGQQLSMLRPECNTATVLGRLRELVLEVQP